LINQPFLSLRITKIAVSVFLAVTIFPAHGASMQPTAWDEEQVLWAEVKMNKEEPTQPSGTAPLSLQNSENRNMQILAASPKMAQEEDQASVPQAHGPVVPAGSKTEGESLSPAVKTDTEQPKEAPSSATPATKSDQQIPAAPISSPNPVPADDTLPAVKTMPATPHMPAIQEKNPDVPRPASSEPAVGSRGGRMGQRGGIPAQSQSSLAAPTVLPKRGLFTLNFDDADVYSVIQTIFGEILRVNYVVDSRIKGRVTFRAVTPVPAESVLPLMEVILRLNGIGIVEDGNLYRIVPISDVSKEPSPVSYGRDSSKIPTTGRALLQVVPILYIKSSEILKLISNFASNNAVLIDVPKGNQLIIVDTDASVKRLLKLVEVFDNERLRQTKQQVFVYQLQNSKAKDTVAVLQQIFLGARGGATDQSLFQSKTGTGSAAGAGSATPGAAGSPQTHIGTISTGSDTLVSETTKIIADEITNTIIIMSTPEDYAAIVKTIEKLDIVPRQVVIEGMIASVSLTDNLSLGLSAQISGKLHGLNSTIALNPSGLDVNPSKLSAPGLTFVGTDAAGVVKAYITALATDSKAKVLASPHVLVSDNREARIQVGQQVPLMTSETYGTAGVSPQRNYQYKDIGIILKVKPRINEGGLVSLEISQEISTFETIPLGGTDQLLLNKTEAATNLVVQDGQTIIIGGLIREDTTKARTGIPFLSKIPLLGWLFGNTRDDKQRQELIILLTPHVLKNQAEAKDVSEEYIDSMSVSSEGRIKKEELLKEKTPRGSGGSIRPEFPKNGNPKP
jgi:general secretion pathway protein D